MSWKSQGIRFLGKQCLFLQHQSCWQNPYFILRQISKRRLQRQNFHRVILISRLINLHQQDFERNLKSLRTVLKQFVAGKTEITTSGRPNTRSKTLVSIPTFIYGAKSYLYEGIKFFIFLDTAAVISLWRQILAQGGVIAVQLMVVNSFHGIKKKGKFTNLRQKSSKFDECSSKRHSRCNLCVS